jgi:hypothetical protein
VTWKCPKLLKLLLNIANICLITLSLAEIALRLCNKIYQSYIFYDSSRNRFRGKPLAENYGFGRNSRGFKDVERKKEKQPNVYRILGLGDSFAFGVVPLIPKGHRHGSPTRPDGGKTPK